MILQIWQGLILGLIQGLGEFLPISSSGHILLGTQLMGLDSGAAAMKLITVLLHVGTLIPVIIIFWKDWWDILRHLFVRKTFFLLIVASVPALVFKLVAGKIMIGDTAVTVADAEGNFRATCREITTRSVIANCPDDNSLPRTYFKHRAFGEFRFSHSLFFLFGLKIPILFSLFLLFSFLLVLFHIVLFHNFLKLLFNSFDD